jgi:RNA polymerase sigma factor (sigma-70 family)
MECTNYRLSARASFAFRKSVRENERNGTDHEIGESDRHLVGMIDRVTLQGAVAQLAPGYRIIFILYDVEGYKHEEIAEILGCTPGNSKSQLNRARMKLQRLLWPRGSFPGGRKSLSIEKYRCFSNEGLAGTS